MASNVFSQGASWTRNAVLASGVGFGIGGATSDSSTSTGVFRDATFTGMMAGVGTAGVGIAAMSIGGAARGSIGQNISRAYKSGLIDEYKKIIGASSGHGRMAEALMETRGRAVGTGRAIRAGLKSGGKFAGLAALGVGVAAGALSMLTDSAGPSAASLQLGQTNASSTGFGALGGAGYEQEANQRFLQSTDGLVQGLHRGRHS